MASITTYSTLPALQQYELTTQKEIISLLHTRSKENASLPSGEVIELNMLSSSDSPASPYSKRFSRSEQFYEPIFKQLISLIQNASTARHNRTSTIFASIEALNQFKSIIHEYMGLECPELVNSVYCHPPQTLTESSLKQAGSHKFSVLEEVIFYNPKPEEKSEHFRFVQRMIEAGGNVFIESNRCLHEDHVITVQRLACVDEQISPALRNFLANLQSKQHFKKLHSKKIANPSVSRPSYGTDPLTKTICIAERTIAIARENICKFSFSELLYHLTFELHDLLLAQPILGSDEVDSLKIYIQIDVKEIHNRIRIVNSIIDFFEGKLEMDVAQNIYSKLEISQDNLTFTFDQVVPLIYEKETKIIIQFSKQPNPINGLLLLPDSSNGCCTVM